MVLVDVEVAAGEQLEVEAAVEGEERQQVIEKADPGRDARVAGAVEVEHEAERGLAARARDERRSARRRAAGRAERCEQDVVLGWPPQRDPDSLGEDPDDEPGCLEALAERLLRAQPDEVAVRLRTVVARGGEGLAHALALGDGRRDVEPRLPQRGCRDPCRRRRDARRRPPPLELGGGLRSRDGVADPQRREAEGLRERPQHDQVRQLGDEWSARDAGELPVRLVDDDRRLRVRARERGDLVRLAQLAGGVVRDCRPRSGRRRRAR